MIESGQQLVQQLDGCQVLRYCTDASESYEKVLPSTKYWVCIGVHASHRAAEFELPQAFEAAATQDHGFSESEARHDAVLRLYIQHWNLKPCF